MTIGHFEILAEDIERENSFHSGLFGWDIERVEGLADFGRLLPRIVYAISAQFFPILMSTFKGTQSFIASGIIRATRDFISPISS
jgi:hypothetical protein